MPTHPFTTLVPNLGVVSAGDTRYTVADVPGLIPGASQGRGLGLDFLRHIERCAVIVHVLDTAAFETDREPVEDLRIIEAELRAYQGDLTQVEGYVPIMERPRVIVLNKIDIPDGRDLAEITRPDLESFGWPVLEVSAVSHEGLKELSFVLAGIVEEERAKRPALEVARPIIRPKAVGRSGGDHGAQDPQGRRGRRSRCVATSPSAGCVRQTLPTTRPWGTLRIA